LDDVPIKANQFFSCPENKNKINEIVAKRNQQEQEIESLQLASPNGFLFLAACKDSNDECCFSGHDLDTAELPRNVKNNTTSEI
jgi:hypothetical protein